MSTLRHLLLAGLCLAPLTILLAQETRLRDAAPPGREPARSVTTTATTAASPQIDRILVSCLKADNQGEITIAKLAEQRATNPEVTAFAQEMIKDHTDFLAKLDRFSQESGARPAASATRTETRRSEATIRPDVPNRTDPAQPERTDKTARTKDPANPPARADVRVDAARGDVTVQTAGHDAGGIADQMVRINQEIHDKCLASVQRELSEKEGKEFDQCFMFMQVGAHMKMVDALSVLKNHTSGELQQTLEQGLQSTQQHLEHAKQLAKKIEGSSTGTTSARPNTDRPGTERPGADATTPRTKERVK